MSVTMQRLLQTASLEWNDSETRLFGITRTSWGLAVTLSTSIMITSTCTSKVTHGLTIHFTAQSSNRNFSLSRRKWKVSEFGFETRKGNGSTRWADRKPSLATFGTFHTLTQ